MNVTIYSTPSCSYCFAAKDFFKEHKIKYKEIDVSKDEKALDKMIDKSGQIGVPVIDIDGTIIIGFDRDAIKKALKI